MAELPASVGAIYIPSESALIYADGLTPLQRLTARLLALSRAAGCAAVVVLISELVDLAA